MCLVSVHVLEGNVARLAIVGSLFKFCVWFLFDVDCGGGRYGRRLFLLRFIGCVDKAGVPDHVASVCGGVCAATAAVDTLPAHCWTWGSRLTTVLF